MKETAGVYPSAVEAEAIELQADNEIGRRADGPVSIQKLRNFRGRLPADFKFDRLLANDGKEANMGN